MGKEAFGFDAAAEVYGDVLKAGIIDPAKVVRCAIQNPASVGSLLLTTEALVAEIPKEKKAPSMPPGCGYGGDDRFEQATPEKTALQGSFSLEGAHIGQGKDPPPSSDPLSLDRRSRPWAEPASLTGGRNS